MKYTPIIFSTPMVQAILNGSKTQTRRIADNFKPVPGHEERYKKDPLEGFNGPYYTSFNCETGSVDVFFDDSEVPYYSLVPKVMPGSRLWVRETWQPMEDGFVNAKGQPFVYKADWREGGGNLMTYGGKWKPSIHMHRAACRIELKVTDIRLERLQHISEGNAQCEGVKEKRGYFLDYIAEKHHTTQFIYNKTTAISSFKTLWEIINGHDGWHKNPWVWVIEFVRV
jgi:hypothetical protein